MLCGVLGSMLVWGRVDVRRLTRGSTRCISNWTSHVETYFWVAFQHVANSNEKGLSDQVNYSICKNAGRYVST